MPEGDTIHRAAALLRRGLEGRTVARFAAPRLAPPFPDVGSTVTGVEARGKHLLIRFSDGLILHTHHRMNGSWRVFPPGPPWQTDGPAPPDTGRGDVRAIIDVGTAVAVCFRSPVVEVLDEPAVRRHRDLRRLGPDLCLPDPDIDGAVRRWGAMVTADTPVGVALLHQGISAGIGNVYRSEVCWFHHLHPATPSGRVDADLRTELLTTASRLLRENLDTPRRTTVPGGLAVYDRAGRACRRCGDAIASGRLGEHSRATFWCPTCQPDPAPPGSPRP